MRLPYLVAFVSTAGAVLAAQGCSSSSTTTPTAPAVIRPTPDQPGPDNGIGDFGSVTASGIHKSVKDPNNVAEPSADVRDGGRDHGFDAGGDLDSGTFGPSNLPACGVSQANTSCDCGGGAACSSSCDNGACTNYCRTAGNCNNSCAGGRCTMLCERGALCQNDCAGGSCTMECMPGSQCLNNCSGGGCMFICRPGSNCQNNCSSDGGRPCNDGT